MASRQGSSPRSLRTPACFPVDDFARARPPCLLRIMNVIREIQRINEEELRRGFTEEQSWHAKYHGSAWVFIGGLSPRLTEGDVVCIFSQWGEIEDIHLVRDEATGVSKGFAFLKYEDWRSTVLAVDNATGAEVLGRTLRVDHKLDYKPPQPKKDSEGSDAAAAAAPAKAEWSGPGHAYAGKELASSYSLAAGVNVFGPSVASSGGGMAASRASAAQDGVGFGSYELVPEPEEEATTSRDHHLPSEAAAAAPASAEGEARESRHHRHRHHHSSSRRHRSRSRSEDSDRRRRRHRSEDEERRHRHRGEEEDGERRRHKHHHSSSRHHEHRRRRLSSSESEGGGSYPTTASNASAAVPALPASSDLPPPKSWRGT